LIYPLPVNAALKPQSTCARKDSHGPTCARRFVEDTHALGDRTLEQWQQDAFGQIDALLRALALRG
jgi:hypothetical protein